jgi:hypothetical protein
MKNLSPKNPQPVAGLAGEKLSDFIWRLVYVLIKRKAESQE